MYGSVAEQEVTDTRMPTAEKQVLLLRIAIAGVRTCFEIEFGEIAVEISFHKTWNV